jgi:aspartate racemase
MHIGLIGGIGPAATEFYYRGLVAECSAASWPLELTIAHADMNVLLDNLAAGAADEQARIFCHHVGQLAVAGAGVAAITSIAGHFCYRELEAISPLPLTSALATLEREVGDRNLHRVGLLGSSVAMETGLYGTLADLEFVLPQGDEFQAVNDEYFAMAGAQIATAAQRELFFSAGARLCSEQGAEAVILAGTDMFLAFAGADPGFAVVDCAEVHIRALAEIARRA